MAKNANMVNATTASNGWSKNHIQHLLMTNDRAVVRGLLQIYARQTEDEKRSGNTKVNNSMGFSGVDGEFLSSISEKMLRWSNSSLTENQMKIVRPKMLKYWAQLLEIAATSISGPSFPKPADQPKRKMH